MIPLRRQSAVFFPIASFGGVKLTAKSRDAREKSDSADTSSPGANAPPRKSPSALTTSKFVVVPKSTTTAGPHPRPDDDGLPLHVPGREARERLGERRHHAAEHERVHRVEREILLPE